LLGDEALSNVEAAEQQKLDNWVSSFVPRMIDTLEGRSYYNELSDGMRSGINNALYNMDWESFGDID